MIFKYFFFLYFFIVACSNTGFCQEHFGKSFKKGLPVTLHVDVNYSPFFLASNYSEKYIGEYFPSGLNDTLVWIESKKNLKLSDKFSILSLGISTSVELDNKYRFGLKYAPIIVKNWSQKFAESSLISNGNNTTFFLISGFFGYNWHYFQSKNKMHALLLFPSIGFGSYIGNNYFQGRGSRFLMNYGVENTYTFRQKVGLNVGFEYAYWRYKYNYTLPDTELKHQESSIFNFATLTVGVKFLIELKKGNQ